MENYSKFKYLAKLAIGLKIVTTSNFARTNFKYIIVAIVKLSILKLFFCDVSKSEITRK